MEIPFFAPINISLTADGQASGQYQNSQNQEFVIYRILQKSTGSFDIINMSNTGSQQYAPVSDSRPMSGDVFPDMATNTDSKGDLPIPLILKGQEILSFLLEDTSSSPNVVNIVLVGKLVKGNN